MDIASFSTLFPGHNDQLSILKCELIKKEGSVWVTIIFASYGQFYYGLA